MTGNAPTHTCSYFCDKPECIKAQRDELREKLAALESQPVPVEPETWMMVEYLVDGEHRKPCHLRVVSKIAYDALQSALKLAQEERDNARNLLSAATDGEGTRWMQAMKRAEKAESINRRMVELLKEPSEGMIAAGYPPNDERAQSWDVTEVFKAMSAELLKQVNG